MQNIYSFRPVSKLEKVNIKVFNINNEDSNVHSLTNGERAKMVLNQCDPDSDHERGVVNTAENVLVENRVKIHDGLIKLEQCAFKTQQEMW